MNFRLQFWKKIVFAISLFSFFCLIFLGSENYSAEEVLKVLRAIDKIRAETLREEKGPLRRIIITESELNSYIAYRIETEKEEIMKELHLNLFEKNKIQGKIFIDLSSQKIPRFLQPQMNFYFEGNLETEAGKVRLSIKKLFLDKQPVPTMILDWLIYISAKRENSETSSLNDWHELPFGIKDLKTHPGQVTVFY